jgi:hypothetical protein
MPNEIAIDFSSFMSASCGLWSAQTRKSGVLCRKIAKRNCPETQTGIIGFDFSTIAAWHNDCASTISNKGGGPWMKSLI